jgi:hypothetical protein
MERLVIRSASDVGTSVVMALIAVVGSWHLLWAARATEALDRTSDTRQPPVSRGTSSGRSGARGEPVFALATEWKTRGYSVRWNARLISLSRRSMLDRRPAS